MPRSASEQLQIFEKRSLDCMEKLLAEGADKDRIAKGLAGL